MNNMDFFLSGSIYIEASLKQSLCSVEDLGATGIILLLKKYFQILWLSKLGWPGVINHYDPVAATRRH